MNAEDSSSASPASVDVKCCRCVDEFIFFEKCTPCGFYVSMLGFRKAYDCRSGIAGCEDVLEIEQGAVHGTRVEKNSCDCRVRVGV